jgi:hypothetical protein
MRLDLKLPDLPNPSLSEALLRQPLADLIKIKTRNEERWGTGSGSHVFENRKEKLRKRLQGAVSPKKELEKIQATEVGWQRLLLGLYIESNGQDWLPAFDDDIASCLLGSDGDAWTTSRRRQAANLFFERFDTLPALAFLAKRLSSSFDNSSMVYGASEAAWKKSKTEIFQTDGHYRISQAAKKSETLQDLMARHAVPTKGVFSVKLRQVFLLETLQNCTLGDEPDVLNEIEKDREKPAVDALPLGAAALRILVSRVEGEGRRKWPKEWRKWLVRLGCDPRMGRHTAEGAKWWGWATTSQWNLAVQGIIGLSLKIFFDFLNGTVSVHQWEERRQFLEACLDAGKIIDARLVLNARCMHRLPSKMRDKWNTANLSSTTEDTCIIALRCTNDVYMLEGTHSYALRAFHRKFPVKGFWERSTQNYTDAELRIHEHFCPVYVRHLGNWVARYYSQLQSEFHVEWSHRKR